MKVFKNNLIGFGISKPLFYGNFISIVLCFSFFSIKTLAYVPEVGRVSASTGPFLFNSDSNTSNSNFYPNPRLGYSLIAEAIFAKNSGLEIGFFYLQKPYFRNDGPNFLIQKTTRMYITTGYRYWWGPYFSTALGIFSSFTMGDAKNLDQSSALPADFKTSAETITNYGADVSFRFEYEIDQKNGLNLDMRYSYSWTKLSSEKADHVLVGLFYRRKIDIK